MNVREDVLLSVLDGQVTAPAATLALGLTPAELEQALEAVRTARARAAHTRRRAWTAGLVVSALVGGFGMVGTALAVGPCAQTLPAPLVTFCPNAPALADEVNGNFQGVLSLVQAKVGTLSAPQFSADGGVIGQSITTPSVTTQTVATTGALTVGSTAAVTGNATVGGGLTVTGAITSGCPTTFPLLGGAVTMVDMGAYCIMNQFDAATLRGLKSWFQTNEYCVSRGLRMCNFAEVSAAVRLGRIRQYDFPTEGDYWVWVDQTASDANTIGMGGCHVNLNPNKSGYLLGESNCAIDGNATNGNIGGLCCL